MNAPSQHLQKRSHTVSTRKILSARQMQKLIKNDGQMFLAIIRTSSDFVPHGNKKTKGNKGSPSYATVDSAHGMTKG